MEIERHIQEIKDAVREADMILVGLGEEFDNLRVFREDDGYGAGKEVLAGSDKSDLIPAWQRFFRESEAHGGERQRLNDGLKKLSGLLENKNYFVVSVSLNGDLHEIPWREGRLVMPCGSDLKKQCGENCPCGVTALTEAERNELQSQMRDFHRMLLTGVSAGLPRGLGKCGECGSEIGLNNIYHGGYNETGYLTDWQNYTKWLQGTLNHNLVILELGVGMQFPSVIRWPFEKIAFFNQRARFYRINQSLYQLTEELSEKGTSIPENAIDWLENL